ncbi:MAG TPA: DsbA family protein, partial [Dietzia sp.]|nr:DsbA family protein [Dietzia sp.]
RLSAPETIRRVGAGVGLPAEAVDQLLDGDGFGDRVREDIETARGIGVRGVPFFVLDGRLAVSGAQPVEVFGQALQQALEAGRA